MVEEVTTDSAPFVSTSRRKVGNFPRRFLHDCADGLSVVLKATVASSSVRIECGTVVVCRLFIDRLTGVATGLHAAGIWPDKRASNSKYHFASFSLFPSLFFSFSVLLVFFVPRLVFFFFVVVFDHLAVSLFVPSCFFALYSPCSFCSLCSSC